MKNNKVSIGLFFFFFFLKVAKRVYQKRQYTPKKQEWEEHQEKWLKAQGALLGEKGHSEEFGAGPEQRQARHSKGSIGLFIERYLLFVLVTGRQSILVEHRSCSSQPLKLEQILLFQLNRIVSLVFKNLINSTRHY